MTRDPLRLAAIHFASAMRRRLAEHGVRLDPRNRRAALRVTEEALAAELELAVARALGYWERAPRPN